MPQGDFRPARDALTEIKPRDFGTIRKQLQILSEKPVAMPNVYTDLDLAREVLSRDRKATAEFIGRYADPVAKYLRSRLLPRVDLVDDLAQEVFLAAWQSLQNYRGDSPLKSWLLGIAKHKVEDHYRRRLRESLVDLPDDDGIQDPGLNQELRLTGEMQQRWTWEILAELPEHYGLVLRWRYWEHRNASEMAQLTSRSEKAVERLLHRAREQFRRKWIDREGAAPAKAKEAK